MGMEQLTYVASWTAWASGQFSLYIYDYNYVHLTNHAWKTGNEMEQLLSFLRILNLYILKSAAFAFSQFLRQLHSGGSVYNSSLAQFQPSSSVEKFPTRT